MIVGSLPSFTPTLQFRPPAFVFDISNPLFDPAPTSLFFALICRKCTLAQKSEAHLLLFQSFARSLQKHRGCRQQRSFEPFNFELLNLFTAKSIRIRTCGRSPRFTRNQPKSSARNSFRIRTYTIPCCKFFRVRTYEKTRGGGRHYVN
jgi:hypothetical protein